MNRFKRDRMFVGLATLPLISPLDAATELERGIDELGLVGAILGTSVRGTFLSDERFLRVFEVAHKKHCILFIHPSGPFGAEKLSDHGLFRSLVFPFETTVALTKMAYSGIFGRFPNLRMVCAHLAGAFPFLQGRLDIAWNSFEDSKGNLSEPPGDKIRNVINLDTISYSRTALKLTSELLGIERLLFGSDFPFEWGIGNAMHSIEGTFDEKQLNLIYFENFERLLGGR